MAALTHHPCCPGPGPWPPCQCTMGMGMAADGPVGCVDEARNSTQALAMQCLVSTSCRGGIVSSSGGARRRCRGRHRCCCWWWGNACGIFSFSFCWMARWWGNASGRGACGIVSPGGGATPVAVAPVGSFLLLPGENALSKIENYSLKPCCKSLAQTQESPSNKQSAVGPVGCVDEARNSTQVLAMRGIHCCGPRRAVVGSCPPLEEPAAAAAPPAAAAAPGGGATPVAVVAPVVASVGSFSLAALVSFSFSFCWMARKSQEHAPEGYRGGGKVVGRPPGRPIYSGFPGFAVQPSDGTK